MPRQFGSDRSVVSTSTYGVVDGYGQSVISGDSAFGGLPLGEAALGQTLFGLPNGTFNLLPPDLSQVIDNDANALPYWSLVETTSDTMQAKTVYDSTTNTYALRLTPGAALSGEYLTMATRSAVISDDSLGLRQRIVATLAKVGTYSGSTQFNISISATYYDHTNTLISTYTAGSVLDNASISSIVGYTTTGSTTVGASAKYVDIAVTMTATANVTSGISVDLKSILLQTSLGGGGSFLITQSFTSSGTFTRPTGVDYVSVVAVGGGGGGGCGGGFGASNTNQSATGGGGGGGSRWAYIPNLYIGDVSTVSVGVGAAGAGATTTPYTKSVGSATENVQPSYGTAAAGGASTFGSYLSVPGGSAGSNGSGAFASSARSGAGGGAAGAAISCSIYGNDSLTSGAGGTGGGTNIGGTATSATAGGTGSGSGVTQLPFMTSVAAGSAGGSGTATADAGSQSGLQTSTKSGGASGNSRVSGGGGGGGAAGNNEPSTASPTTYTSSGADAGMNGGGGGGGATMTRTAAITGFTVAGGAGGAGGLYGGGGGGGGAGNISLDSALSEWTASQGTFSGGAGGAGGAGIVIVSWVG